LKNESIFLSIVARFVTELWKVRRIQPFVLLLRMLHGHPHSKTKMNLKLCNHTVRTAQ